jgi:type IV secretion system protein VirB9
VLRSTGDGKKWYQRVSWLYNNDLELEVDDDPDGQTHLPMAATAAARPASGIAGAPQGVASIDPESLRFGYEITGDAPFRPRLVFDDGRFTYFKMPEKLQELPALFAVIEDKDYSLVNFEVKGDYLVAQRLLTTAVLKLGKAEVRVVNPAPKRTFLGLTREAP